MSKKISTYFQSDFNYTIPSSVAIVGNSGVVLENTLGSEIDDHDWILRFNGAEVEGYEKHVGSKTTFRCLNSVMHLGHGINASTTTTEDMNRIANGERLIFKPSGSKRRKKAIEFYEDLADELLFLNNRVYSLSKRKLRKYNTHGQASLGFLMTVLLSECSRSDVEIDLYGFGFHMKSDVEKRHYFEDLDEDISGPHDYSAEKKLMKRMQQQDKIQIKY
jgi:hypothetical protein